MEGRLELKRKRNSAFLQALAEFRIKFAAIHGTLVFLALGAGSERVYYLIAGIYLSMNLLCWLVPVCNFWARRWLLGPLSITDLLVSTFFIRITGGPDSPLYPFWFLPVFAAAVRFRYAGVFIWSTFSAVVWIGASYWNRPELPNLSGLFIKLVYLYLTGFVASRLITRTYKVTEEMSRNLTQWNDKLQRLNDYSLEVTASSNLDDIFKQTMKAVLQNNPSLATAIMMFESDLLKVYESAKWEEEWLERYGKNPLSKDSLTLAPIQVFREPLICADIGKHPELVKIFQGTPVKALFAFPIMVDREVAGVLMIAGTQQRGMAEAEIRMMTGIANQCGNAIQHIASIRSAKLQADTDGLTGLYNRRYFNEQLEKHVNESSRYEVPVSLILMDVDNFKKYNDTYGHPAGDQLLKRVAAIVSETVREQGSVARYGGEEFAVILRHTGNPLAFQIAERIRQAVENLPGGQLRSPITISLGVATMPDHAENRGELLEYADRSLYHAKHSGKNRVCCGFE